MDPLCTIQQSLRRLGETLHGELYLDASTRVQYATDASVYRELPIAVALPRGAPDLQQLIRFARSHGIPLIPRAAGTSLAGQVVGGGLVVDMSRYWGRIIELNPQARWVRVEPGVILDELNAYLAPHGLMFGPETSTSNRCTVGGMVGNNSCGAHSILYGSTRDHTLSLRMMLDDAQEYEFGPMAPDDFAQKMLLPSREGEIYRRMHGMICDRENQQEILSQFPHPAVTRRNTGYALDLLLDNPIAGMGHRPFNFCRLIAGSEGTLGLITEVTLNLVPLPPEVKALICVHLEAREQAFPANLIALSYSPGAVELMDHLILECTKGNAEQQRNRFFVRGNPGAILIVEFARDTRGEIEEIAARLEAEMRAAGFGYHFPTLWGEDIARVWALRKAGLGVLSNLEGDAKPVSLVEDTAVAVDRLPEYMAQFAAIIEGYGLQCVYHAHIGSGELHLRPVLNLKSPKDVGLFRAIAFDVARLVKRFGGSMSGEHGDGRLRGELIPILVGHRCYELMRAVKRIWDPQGVFNPGKIVDTPPLTSSMRYTPGQPERPLSTLLRFHREGGILRAVEKCNGSADCRKTLAAGGTMCPSYMATRHEGHTTRARANVIREFLTRSPKSNPFDHQEIYDILDLCLSCKGCKSECPSSVDMAKLKAEFLHQWAKAHGIPLRSRVVAGIARFNRVGSIAPNLINQLLSSKIAKKMVFTPLGFEPRRQLPTLHPFTLRQWRRRHPRHGAPGGPTVYLLADEFTGYNDTPIGVKAIELLEGLGYRVLLAPVSDSGRAHISKGLLRTAQRLADRNIERLRDTIGPDCPLVGLEPSAILSFRDEYPDLVSEAHLPDAEQLAASCLLLEEFIMRQVEAGRIGPWQFDGSPRRILLHGHCQQKALASTQATRAMLALPSGHSVSEIPSGCCGMAGAFGYEREHYPLSMAVGELVLFPQVRGATPDTLIAAPGTSCRHHIKDGTGRAALHPVEIMWEALRR